jgi:hypothetical protein
VAFWKKVCYKKSKFSNGRSKNGGREGEERAVWNLSIRMWD